MDAACRAVWAGRLGPGARVLDAGGAPRLAAAARTLGCALVGLEDDRPAAGSFDGIVAGEAATLSLGACRALLVPGGALLFAAKVSEPAASSVHAAQPLLPPVSEPALRAAHAGGDAPAEGAPTPMDVNGRLAAAGLAPIAVEVVDRTLGYFVARAPGGRARDDLFGGAEDDLDPSAGE